MKDFILESIHMMRMIYSRCAAAPLPSRGGVGGGVCISLIAEKEMGWGWGLYPKQKNKNYLVQSNESNTFPRTETKRNKDTKKPRVK